MEDGCLCFFFFQAEDGIRDLTVTGVQTCALPILRQADVVGRLGGDEFGVLMPETDGDVAHAAANRLVSSIRTVFRGTPSVTASVGVVAVSGTEAGTDELLRKADQAM